MKLKPHEISKKFNELMGAEQAFQNQDFLLSQREALEDKIDTAKQAIKSYDHQSGALKEFKQELRRIDAILDEWEDLTALDLYTMRERLLNDIWENYPDEYEEQKQQWNELKTCFVLEIELFKTLDIVRPIQDILETILHTRSKIKGKGLLSYIFGISPNAIIERHLTHAGEFIRVKIPDLERSLQETEGLALYPLFRHVYNALSELSTHCTKVWGFRHIDTSIASSKKELAEKSEIMEQQLTEVRMKKDLLMKALNEWMASFA